MISNNKIICDLKNGKIRIFFRIFGINKGRLGEFGGSLRVPNFSATSLFARNSNPTIELLGISKTAKLEFSFGFLEQIRVVLGCYAVHWGFPIFL